MVKRMSDGDQADADRNGNDGEGGGGGGANPMASEGVLKSREFRKAVRRRPGGGGDAEGLRTALRGFGGGIPATTLMANGSCASAPELVGFGSSNTNPFSSTSSRSHHANSFILPPSFAGFCPPNPTTANTTTTTTTPTLPPSDPGSTNMTADGTSLTGNANSLNTAGFLGILTTASTTTTTTSFGFGSATSNLFNPGSTSGFSPSFGGFSTSAVMAAPPGPTGDADRTSPKQTEASSSFTPLFGGSSLLVVTANAPTPPTQTLIAPGSSQTTAGLTSKQTDDSIRWPNISFTPLFGGISATTGAANATTVPASAPNGRDPSKTTADPTSKQTDGFMPTFGTVTSSLTMTASASSPASAPTNHGSTETTTDGFSLTRLTTNSSYTAGSTGIPTTATATTFGFGSGTSALFSSSSSQSHSLIPPSLGGFSSPALAPSDPGSSNGFSPSFGSSSFPSVLAKATAPPTPTPSDPDSSKPTPDLTSRQTECFMTTFGTFSSPTVTASERGSTKAAADVTSEQTHGSSLTRFDDNSNTAVIPTTTTTTSPESSTAEQAVLGSDSSTSNSFSGVSNLTHHATSFIPPTIVSASAAGPALALGGPGPNTPPGGETSKQVEIPASRLTQNANGDSTVEFTGIPTTLTSTTTTTTSGPAVPERVGTGDSTTTTNCNPSRSSRSSPANSFNPLSSSNVTANTPHVLTPSDPSSSSQPTADLTSKQADASSSMFNSSTRSVDEDYNQELAALNRSVRDWIATHRSNTSAANSSGDSSNTRSTQHEKRFTPSFGGFSSAATVMADAAATPVLVLSDPASSTEPMADVTSERTGGWSPTRITTDDNNSSSKTGSVNNNARERELAALNVSVRDWISKHVDDDPILDLSPVFRDYVRHLGNVEKKYSGMTTEAAAAAVTGGSATVLEGLTDDSQQWALPRRSGTSTSTSTAMSRTSSSSGDSSQLISFGDDSGPVLLSQERSDPAAPASDFGQSSTLFAFTPSKNSFYSITTPDSFDKNRDTFSSSAAPFSYDKYKHGTFGGSSSTSSSSGLFSQPSPSAAPSPSPSGWASRGAAGAETVLQLNAESDESPGPQVTEQSCKPLSYEKDKDAGFSSPPPSGFFNQAASQSQLRIPPAFSTVSIDSGEKEKHAAFSSTSPFSSGLFGQTSPFRALPPTAFSNGNAVPSPSVRPRGGAAAVESVVQPSNQNGAGVEPDDPPKPQVTEVKVTDAFHSKRFDSSPSSSGLFGQASFFQVPPAFSTESTAPSSPPCWTAGGVRPDGPVVQLTCDTETPPKPEQEVTGISKPFSLDKDMQGTIELSSSYGLFGQANQFRLPQAFFSTESVASSGAENGAKNVGSDEPTPKPEAAEVRETTGAENGANEEPSDETNPKPQVREVREADAFYSKRCKLFYQKEEEFREKGVGTLHLKPTPTGRTQLLVRADTNLGNVLLNIVLQASLPCSRMGRNNVLVVCIPNPSLDPQDPGRPLPLLIRVKTAEEADELHKLLEERKVV